MIGSPAVPSQLTKFFGRMQIGRAVVLVGAGALRSTGCFGAEGTHTSSAFWQAPVVVVVSQKTFAAGTRLTTSHSIAVTVVPTPTATQPVEELDVPAK